MLILHNSPDSGKQRESSIAAIFGVGLIGVHLVRSLYQYQYKTIHSLAFSWQGSSHRKQEKADILYCIRNLIKKIPCRIDFVWSAGKGGFAMDQSETLTELDSFSEVVEMAIALSRENPSCLVRFHLISSAGGLFEGQRNVNNSSLPSPRRPYAFLKLAQEKMLDDCGQLVRFIYRPSSVYGFAGLNRRMGLIPTLLLNGSKNKVSTIFGAPETLRDYVWADDVGAFMAGMIASKPTVPGPLFLASGKPSTLFEIFSRIEKILNKKLFCHYVNSGGNVEHNTFSMKICPVDWKPKDLKIGIRKTHQAMLLNLP